MAAVNQKPEVQETYENVVRHNIVTLAWKDPQKKDELFIKDKMSFKDEMKARAKGTTVYELIDAVCPGSKDPDVIKERMSATFPEKPGATYGDQSKVPEFFNDKIVQELQAEVNAYIKQKYAEKLKEQEEKKKAAESTSSETGKEGE